MNSIIIFTDGATPNNQSSEGNRKGGIGVFFGENDPRNISITLKENKYFKVTNNVCELMACIKGLETIISSQIINNNKIILYTDSMYIVNSIEKWASKWEKNNWRKSDGSIVLNSDLIKRLYYLSKNLKVTFTHIKSHTKEPPKDSPNYSKWYGNYMADKLASDAAK